MVTAQAPPAIDTAIPLLFSYRDCLFGNGFVVEVVATYGRALCVRESDGVWMYGVNPGAMAAVGDTAEEALAAFRALFSGNLKDLALESNSFDEFKAKAAEFFNDTNPGHEREWLRAVEAVRRNEVEIDGLPRVPADSQRTISVTAKKAFTAADNEANLELQLPRAA
jgi:hypothetical protein